MNRLIIIGLAAFGLAACSGTSLLPPPVSPVSGIPATPLSTTVTPSSPDFAMMVAERSAAFARVQSAQKRHKALPSADVQLLCAGEKPEGPGFVNDVEHIPGTNPPVVAPSPIKEILQGIEFADYSICVKWCRAHKGQC